MQYCESIFAMKRRPVRTVMVGNVPIGSAHPIRIQSMTTSNTRDVQATIDQIIRLADVGCEIARVTVQGMKEAEACEGIKNGLIKRGYTIPLVADIHFFPPAAMRVADFVDKVRINPGNYVDKRASFKVLEYDDASYQIELDRIEEKFTPLVEKCKRLKRSMRIGTNHGSLSDRIMNRYGDTPRGMVESAVEFANVCRKNDYHDFMFSMKSSNPQVMVHAYRLLAAEMYKLGWDYPLHLGVTEAGEGEDGRVKSAMGIGALLLEGLGDTIRVSLTEDPWFEIDPCKRLIHFAESYASQGVAPFVEKFRDWNAIKRRHVEYPKGIALHRNGSVFIGLKADDFVASDLCQKVGYKEQLEHPQLQRDTADQIVLREPIKQQATLKQIQKLQAIGIGITSLSPDQSGMLLLTLAQATEKTNHTSLMDRFALKIDSETHQPFAIIVQDEPSTQWEIIAQVLPSVIFLSPTHNRLFYSRQFFEWLQQKQLLIPVILHFTYDCSSEDLILQTAAECGSLLCDGLGDGLWIEGPYDRAFLRNLSFNILQAARMRTFKTDFISCPSCGRTLFDLQDVTKRIRARTAHLPGVKIAIMGCIVNGPGEMADADFGYVGSKPGKIDLYVGKTCVEKDIDFSAADDRLVDLIKAHGKWLEKEENKLELV